MAGDWTTIIVRPQTAAWIQNEARHLVGEHQRGSIALELTERSGKQRGCGLSADAVLWRLIQAHEVRKARRRRAAKKRGRRKKTAAGESVPPTAGPVAQS